MTVDRRLHKSLKVCGDGCAAVTSHKSGKCELHRCNCGNPHFGFDCVCEWVEEHPGDREFTCEFCGLYFASEARCNKCEESEVKYVIGFREGESSHKFPGLLCCKYCGNPFDQQFRHTTCGLE